MNNLDTKLLFTILFALTFGWMGNQMLSDIFPIGIGEILKNGLGKFLIQLLIVGFTFLLSAIGFLLALKYVKIINNTKFIIQLFDLVIILTLSCIPWFSYHIIRIIFKPITKIYEWKSILLNVDVLFVSLYCISVSLIFFLKKLFMSIVK